MKSPTHNLPKPGEIDAIFSNVNDVTELTMTLIALLEDTLEMKEEDNEPAVGSCFEELAEAQEFDVYTTYAKDILSNNFKTTLDGLLNRQDVSEALDRASGYGYRNAVKYYLPMLLQGPIYHCFHYFKYIQLLMKATESDEERNTLKQVLSVMTCLQTKLTVTVDRHSGNFGSTKRTPGDIFHSLEPNRMSRQQSLQKLSQIQQSITGWEGPQITASCSKHICEGKLKIIKGRGNGSFQERYVFLFDGMIVITKPHKAAGGHPSGHFSFKACHLIKNVEVRDREDIYSGSAFSMDSTRHDSVSSTSSLVGSGMSLVGGNPVTSPAITGLLSSASLTNDVDSSNEFELKTLAQLGGQGASTIFKVCISDPNRNY